MAIDFDYMRRHAVSKLVIVHPHVQGLEVHKWTCALLVLYAYAEIKHISCICVHVTGTVHPVNNSKIVLKICAAYS